MEEKKKLNSLMNLVDKFFDSVFKLFDLRLESCVSHVFSFTTSVSPFIDEDELKFVRKDLLLREEEFLIGKSISNGFLFVVISHSDFLAILNLMTVRFSRLLRSLTK